MGYLDELSKITKTMANARHAVDQTKHKSIARGALDGTLQFPCLVSDDIPIDKSSVIASTLERVYASFVQSYLSLNNTINISVDKNPSMFLRRFHQNVKLESTAEDLYYEYCVEDDEEYNELMKRIYDGRTKAYLNENESKMIIFNFSDGLNRSVFESHKELLEQSLSAIDFYPFPNVSNSPFYEAIGNGDIGTYTATSLIDQGFGALSDDRKLKNDIEKEKFKYQYGGQLSVPSVLKDNDVKKQNELQPYMMQVRLMAVNDDNQFVQFMDFVVGVKVVLHSIKSDEMIINIKHTMENNGKLFNIIRWTTGEKSLFKDLLLHINDVKLDVANKSKGTSPWWSTLKRLKDTSRVQASFFSRNQVVPNSTIVISSYVADIVEKQNGFNLRDPKIAKKLMSTLFLMNFVIVDEGTRTLEILYDGENAYQTYALETLEREVSMNSNKLGKEITRMISR